ncbi:hypothetical protein TNCV_5137131 [Trichonephila clavipes]|nr:hypothetical protein TNCV_5137131 [Trichonephila clavipes]
MEFSSKTIAPLKSPGWMSIPLTFVINWPPRSPDLNPIENLRDILEQDGKDHHTAPTNLTKLWTALADV